MLLELMNNHPSGDVDVVLINNATVDPAGSESEHVMSERPADPSSNQSKVPSRFYDPYMAFATLPSEFLFFQGDLLSAQCRAVLDHFSRDNLLV
jgi:hypothetical protein